MSVISSKMFFVTLLTLLLSLNALQQLKPQAFSEEDEQLQIRRILHETAIIASNEWNCSISLAFKNKHFEAFSAFGTIDFQKQLKASADDLYPFGSATKTVTAASVLSLVAKGVFGLDDLVADLVDPMLAKMAANSSWWNTSSLAEIIPEEHLMDLTVRNLLSMTAGLPDYNSVKSAAAEQQALMAADPAAPPLAAPEAEDEPDRLRTNAKASPQKHWNMEQLLHLPWIKDHWVPCAVGDDCYRYSSTGFLLLGMVLAAQSGEESFYTMDQRKFLPASVREEGITFGQEQSPPSSYTTVHGYDRTESEEYDFWNANSVFHGWAGANMVATPMAVARFTYALFSKDSDFLPRWMVELATTPVQPKYGLGVQLARGAEWTGQSGTIGELWGHSGSRWGYNSFLEFSPRFEFALAGASNVENTNHEQMTQAMCFAYNRLAAFYLGVGEPICKVTGTGCSCSKLVEPTIVVAKPAAMGPSINAGTGDNCACLTVAEPSPGSVPQSELGCHVSPFTGRRICYVASTCSTAEVSVRYNSAKFVEC